MKYIKKFKGMVLLSLVGMFCLMSISSIQAASRFTTFGGAASYSYALVSGPNKKPDDANYARVQWTYSNKNKHNMWFMMVNGVGGNRGKSLLQYKEDKLFKTSGSAKNYDYYLKASREYIADPSTYVSGQWSS